MAILTSSYLHHLMRHYQGTPYKWLDIRRLCELLLPDYSIERIKYFTARISAREGDPGQATRQQVFFRALRTIPDSEIIYGSFLSHEVIMPLGVPPEAGSKFVKVICTEEKGSDVNIAAHLIHDPHQRSFGTAILVSNDSDFQEPIRIIRELELSVGILNPHRQRASRALLEHASFMKQIRKGALKSSQFPANLRDEHGAFHKPHI